MAGYHLQVLVTLAFPGFIGASKQMGKEEHASDRERGSRMKVIAFCNLFVEVTLHHFCCVLFIKESH